MARSLHTFISERLKMFCAMFDLLTESQKRTYRFSVLWMFCSSLLEIFTLGLFVFFLKVITTPELLAKSKLENVAWFIVGNSSIKGTIVILGCILILLFLFKNWVTYKMFSSFNKFIYGVAARLSHEQLNEYFSLEFLEVEKRNSAEYARKIIHVPIEFSQHIVLGSMVILSEAVLTILLCASIIIFNFTVFFLIMGFFLPFIAITRFISIRKLRHVKKTIHSLNDTNAKFLSDVLNSYVDAKIYGKENYFIQRYREMQESLNKELALLNSINTLPAKLSEVFLICAFVTIFFISQFSGDEYSSGITTIAAVFVAFLYRTIPSVNKILALWSNAHTYASTITLLQPFSISSSSNPVPARDIEQRKFLHILEVKNISFQYEGRDIEILENISMKIHKGEVVGLVGKSGSGKTTLLHLLLRMLNISSGTIELDGVPANNISAASWQSLFAFVKQSPFLLHDTIEANIAFGIEPGDIDRTKVLESLRLAGLKNFLLELPNGVETNIGERGKQLSGGQKQRIVIARALYRNAEIFIFDEATSELDSVSEKEIIETIKTLQKNAKTIIIASHYSSTLIPCDVVFEIRNGKILQRKKRTKEQTGKSK